LTTFDLCAEVLSGIGAGTALGYAGPAGILLKGRTEKLAVSETYGRQFRQM
jgi:hypothetical protein